MNRKFTREESEYLMTEAADKLQEAIVKCNTRTVSSRKKQEACVDAVVGVINAIGALK